jgi:hypothetical protein
MRSGGMAIARSGTMEQMERRNEWRRMMRQLAVILAALLSLGGCAAASGGPRAAADAAGAAAPGPDLVGTWRGTAFAVAASYYGLSTPVELTINADGTWSWSKRGDRQAAGHAVMRGNRVLLVEAIAKENGQTIELMLRGDHLWGVSRAFIPGWVSAVDLQRGPAQGG